MSTTYWGFGGVTQHMQRRLTVSFICTLVAGGATWRNEHIATAKSIGLLMRCCNAEFHTSRGATEMARFEFLSYEPNTVPRSFVPTGSPNNRASWRVRDWVSLAISCTPSEHVLRSPTSNTHTCHNPLQLPMRWHLILQDLGIPQVFSGAAFR